MFYVDGGLCGLIDMGLRWAEGLEQGRVRGTCGLTNFCGFFLFTPSGVGTVPLDAFVFLLALLPVGARARLVVLCPSYVLAYEWCFGCAGR